MTRGDDLRSESVLMVFPPITRRSERDQILEEVGSQ
jgi:hypothetical protein